MFKRMFERQIKSNVLMETGYVFLDDDMHIEFKDDNDLSILFLQERQ